MDAIGGYSFIRVSGAIDIPGKILPERTEPGEDGAVYEFEATRAQESEIKAVANYATVGAADSELLAYKALIGTNVTVTQYGRTQTGVTVLWVEEDREGRKNMARAVGGRGSGLNHVMRTTWRVRYCAPS